MGATKERTLRWAPALIVLSSAASLVFSVPPTGDVRTVTGVVLGLAALLIVVAKMYTEKAWALRVASSVCSATTIGVLLMYEPEWKAVLGAFFPIIGLLLMYGPPFGSTSGPLWLRGPEGVLKPDSTSELVLCALSGYLLLAEAVVFQFVETTYTVVVVSFFLSVLSVLTILLVSVHRELNFIRRWSHIGGLAAQIYLSSLEKQTNSRALLVLSAVVAAIFSVPPTL